MQMTHRVFAGWAGAADNDEVRDGAIACKPRKDLKEGFCGFAGHGDRVMFR